MKGILSTVCSLLMITAIRADGTGDVGYKNPEFAYPDGAALRTAQVEFNDGGVQGVVKFTQSGNGPVVLVGTIKGLTPGKHGFHIHESGNISRGCGGAGAHFNPENKLHGDRHSAQRHVGDLGNIEADSTGTAVVAFEDVVIKLTGKHGIVGRAVVIHDQPDDLGKGNNEESTKTGNAGSRIACATIKPKHPAGPWRDDNAATRWQPQTVYFVVLSTFITFVLARVA